MYVDLSGQSWNSFWSNVGSFFNKIGNWISDTFGLQINFGIEVPTFFDYFGLISYEGEFGNNISLDNEKPINIFVNIPAEFWKFWEYSIGVDINIGGRGLGLSIGGESSLILHLGRDDFSIYSNLLGRVGFKLSTKKDEEKSSYSKLSLNLPEIGATILLVGGLILYYDLKRLGELT